MGVGIGTTPMTLSENAKRWIRENPGGTLPRKQAVEFMVDHLLTALAQVKIPSLESIPPELQTVVFDYLYRAPASIMPALQRYAQHQDPIALKNDIVAKPLTGKNFRNYPPNVMRGIEKRNAEVLATIGVEYKPDVNTPVNTIPQPTVPPMAKRPEVSTPIADAIKNARATISTTGQSPQATGTPQAPASGGLDMAEIYHDLLNPGVSAMAFLNKLLAKRGMLGGQAMAEPAVKGGGFDAAQEQADAFDAEDAQEEADAYLSGEPVVEGEPSIYGDAENPEPMYPPMTDEFPDFNAEQDEPAPSPIDEPAEPFQPVAKREDGEDDEEEEEGFSF
jgi:hypothetical protein